MPTRKRSSHKSSSGSTRQWRKMDLHLHTPASVDYREQNVSYLDLLKKAEERGLDIISFTDHNTVAGYGRYLDEVESLTLLERLNRLTDTEREQLAEYRRLQEKLLILPGFEITATLGFHILGVFPPETSLRELEHLLLDLRVPADKLDLGSGEVGATSDVLTVYRLIDEAGGVVIAAHANSSHGVAMPGFDFGGQTRISYTQDAHLHALEVTDLTSKSRRRTALFFSGTKPEYPRRMHLIQSSDSHRLTGLPHNNQELGVGDRPTEILLDELSFDAIKDVFLGNDFARVRPYVPSEPQTFDPISQAREEGDTLVQAFHEHLTRGRGVERKIMQDVVALANTNGGTIYVGLSANPRQAILGVQRPGEGIHQLKSEISKCVVPPLEVQLDAQKIGQKSIIRIIVPRGSEVPYALDGTQIYVRSENETSLAVRDEIVNLVRDSVVIELAAKPAVEEKPAEPQETSMAPAPEPEAAPLLAVPAPRTGVEVIPTQRRKGELQYAVRDLRNNRLIHNVTRSSARKLWQYAITESEEHPIDPKQAKWQGDIGLCKAHKRAGKIRFDLVERDSAGNLHVYYGVTEDGIHGPWKALIEAEGAEQAELVETEEIEMGEEPERSELEPFEREEPGLFEEDEPSRVESLEPDQTRVAQWPPQDMIASSEQEEPAPSELDVDSGELRPIEQMGFQVESIPDSEVMQGPDGSPFAEQTFTAESARDEEHARGELHTSPAEPATEGESAPPLGDYAGPSFGQSHVEQAPEPPALEPMPEPSAATPPAAEENPPTEAEIHQEIIDQQQAGAPAESQPSEGQPAEEPVFPAPEPTRDLWQEPAADFSTIEQFNPPSPAEAVPPSAELTEEGWPGPTAQPGRSILPPLGTAVEGEGPSLDISPDTDTMGEPPSQPGEGGGTPEGNPDEPPPPWTPPHNGD